MLKSLLLTGATVLALTGTAAADTPAGTYVGLAAGANWLEDYDFFVGKNDENETETGYYLGGVVGHKWDNGIRAEFEVAFRDNGIAFETATSFDLDQHALSGMVNILYDLDVGEGMALSLGGGAGAARISWVSDFGFEGRDVVFAYQGIAEFEAMVDDNVGVFLGYNYFVADSWDIADAQASYIAHTVKLGVKYHFSQPEVTPTRSALDTVITHAKHPQGFIVFFNFDKSDLTPESRAVIAEAASFYAKHGNLTVSVVAHTDTMGTAAYNLALSQRRADAVKAGLAAEGVPADAIETVGKGFSEPLVETGPGIKEPQNRRATIDMTGPAS